MRSVECDGWYVWLYIYISLSLCVCVCVFLLCVVVGACMYIDMCVVESGSIVHTLHLEEEVRRHRRTRKHSARAAAGRMSWTTPKTITTRA